MKIYIPPVRVEWKIIEEMSDGLVLEREGLNLITNAGRDLLLKDLFMLSGSAGVVACGVGASSTTADVSDTHLTYELIGNAARKTLTNTNGDPLSGSDIVDETTTISSVTYYKKLVCQAVWDSGDSNNGNQFAEYGLFTTDALPGTPTGTSGTMFNHYIDPSPTNKSASNSITVQITLRF